MTKTSTWTSALTAAIAAASSLFLAAGPAQAAGTPVTAYQPQWLADDNGGAGIINLDLLATAVKADQVAPTATYPATAPAGYTYQFAKRTPTSAPENYYPAATGLAKSSATGVTTQFLCIDFFAQDPDGSTYAPTTWADAGTRAPGLAARAAAIASTVVTDQAVTDAKARVGYEARARQKESAGAFRGAVTQMAVWYFADGVVAPPIGYTRANVPANNQANSDVVHILTDALVTEAQKQGAYTEPAPASLTITPATAKAASTGIAGPFTATSNGSPITVDTSAGNLFADADATTPLTSPVASGTRFWTRQTATGDVTISATTEAQAVLGTINATSGGAQNAMLLGSLTGPTLTAEATAAFAPTTPTPTPTTSVPTRPSTPATTTAAPTVSDESSTTSAAPDNEENTSRAADSSQLANTGASEPLALALVAAALLLLGVGLIGAQHAWGRRRH